MVCVTRGNDVHKSLCLCTKRSCHSFATMTPVPSLLHRPYSMGSCHAWCQERPVSTKIFT
ncbi:hypothetical protein Mapa_011911 [Marchantia paleacea]|nr:hypothetical protein Mapa_011911 [Marchantia paleacea]